MENSMEKEKQGRRHRVGTVTCGLMFIVYGVFFLLHTIMPKLSYGILFDLWPLVLVFLGVEILVSCTRKNQEEKKIVYDFPAVLLVLCLVVFVVIMAAADYGMRTANEWRQGRLFGYSTGYFSRYSAQAQDGQSAMEGRVYVTESDAVSVEEVKVEKETTITVSGYLERITGDAALFFTTQDGTDIFIADCDSNSFHKTVTIPAGEGSLCFAATAGDAVCDFDIQILWGDGVSLKQEAGEAAESIEEIESSLPEETDALEMLETPEMDAVRPIEEMDDPVIDNWPESIRCDSEGMYAGLYTIPVTIEEPMELLLSCTVESGNISMWIKDANGRKVFDEQDMWTYDYKIPIDKAGDYTVCFEAEYFYGSFVITPHN